MDKACEFFSKYESKDLKSLENSQEFNNDFKSFIIDLNDELNNSEIEEELKNESEKDKDDYKDHECRCGSKNCIGYIISSDDWKKYGKYINKIIKNRSK